MTLKVKYKISVIQVTGLKILGMVHVDTHHGDISNLVLENKYKVAVPIFGAAYAAPK